MFKNSPLKHVTFLFKKLLILIAFFSMFVDHDFMRIDSLTNRTVKKAGAIVILRCLCHMNDLTRGFTILRASILQAGCEYIFQSWL